MGSVAKDAKGIIVKYLQDMHSLESHGRQAVGRQVEQLQGKGHPESEQAVQGFKATLEGHVQAIEGRLRALDASASNPVQDVASAAAGIVAGIYNAVRSEEASKSIRDDYTFFSHSAISYLMLHATCAGLGDGATAELAATGYRDMARLAMQIDRLMPGLVLEELRQDGQGVADVGGQCAQLVRDAWTQQAPATTGTMAS